MKKLITTVCGDCHKAQTRTTNTGTDTEWTCSRCGSDYIEVRA